MNRKTISFIVALISAGLLLIAIPLLLGFNTPTYFTCSIGSGQVEHRVNGTLHVANLNGSGQFLGEFVYTAHFAGYNSTHVVVCAP